MGARVALVACLLLTGCRTDRDALTLAIALLPGELPAYRAVLGEFERTSGHRTVLVPQQYADIRRALAAERPRGAERWTSSSWTSTRLPPPRPTSGVLDGLDPSTRAALDPAALRAGTVDGLRFLPHRVTWQALVYDHDALPRPPASWDELVAVARAHPGKIGFKGSLYEGLTCDVLPFVWAAGGRGDRLDDDGALAAFRLFAELAPYVHPQSETFRSRRSPRRWHAGSSYCT